MTRETLLVLAKAGRIASPWLPGMATTAGQRVLEVRDGVVRRLAGRSLRDEGLSGDVDVNDPATRGALLALLREACGNAHVSTVYEDRVAPIAVWVVCAQQPLSTATVVLGVGPTEGEALASALALVMREALASEAQP